MSDALPNAHLIDIKIKMPATHHLLYDLAAKCGGVCTKRFAQGSDDPGKGLGYWYHKRAGMHGVCKALCIYWIGCHSMDQDFWAWLQGPNGATMQAPQAAQIIKLQGEFLSKFSRPTGNLAIESWTDQKLAAARLIPRADICTGDRMRDIGMANHSNPFVAGWNIGEGIAPNYRLGGSYKQLSFQGPQGGHAVAAWVDEDVAFFDPNYGEYWFETRRKFREWFGLFWIISGYSTAFPGMYVSSAYARRVN